MTASSLIFWAIFAIPLIGFMVWLMRQDKRRGKFGLVVLAVIVVGVIVYMAAHNMFQPYTATPE